MTVSSAMILVDQTSVPLGDPDAMSDLGGETRPASGSSPRTCCPWLPSWSLVGRLGDIFELRKIFVIGAVIVSGASALAGFAQDVPWMI